VRPDTRLLFITAWPLDTLGGIQTLVRSLADALAGTAGIQVFSITGAMPGAPTVALRTPPLASVRIPFEAHPRPGWLPPARELIGRGCLQGLDQAVAAARPDVVISVSHHSAEAHQASKAATALGVPWVIWPLIHADVPQHVSQTAVKLYRNAALVVSSSSVERRWLTEDAELPAAQTLLLECGSWAAEMPMRPARPPRPAEPVTLLTVGELSAHKRIADQVEAVARLRAEGLEARLTIAGVARGRGELDRLTRLVREKGLEVSVSLIPDAPESTLEALYLSADYFLFTSASESFGLVLLDAICASVFPIVYPHSTYAGLVDGSGFGRVAARATPEALAAAVRRAIEDGEPRVGPLAAWRDAHAWPRVAASLLARLRELRS
jgi:glycosyltransferase involved in cell wall biosynthesis